MNLDMTFCVNKDCPIRIHCERSKFPESKVSVSNANFEFNQDLNRCEYFKPVLQEWTAQTGRG